MGWRILHVQHGRNELCEEKGASMHMLASSNCSILQIIYTACEKMQVNYNSCT